MNNSIAEYVINKTENFSPKIAIITGSGMGDISGIIDKKFVINYSEVPDMPQSSIPGHSGRFIIGYVSSQKVICMEGRVHLYEGYNESDIYKICEALKLIGVEQIIITNAAGSLSPDMPPSSIMLIEDHINFSGKNPLVGKVSPFVSGGDAYDPQMIKKLKLVASQNNIKIFTGTYLMVLGPNFETPAEIKMFQSFGANAIGMSTIPEVLSCLYLKMKIAGISLITNFGTNMCPEKNSHEQTLKNAEESTNNIRILIQKYIESL